MEKELIQIRRIQNGQINVKQDDIAVEHELTILLQDGREIRTTCTPSHLDELVLGRRFLEGDMTENELAQWPKSEQQLEKRGYEPVQLLERVSLTEIFSVAKNSFENPGSLFADTGCAHSCVLVNNGKVICAMEDIGRHNALDKVIGYAIKHQISSSQSYIFASGRIAGDYIRKAYKAGFSMVVSRAAVTSAAVSFAKEHDMTLVGFVRKNTGNIYHEGKVKLYE